VDQYAPGPIGTLVIRSHIELDPLRERERAGVVHRVGYTAHVRLRPAIQVDVYVSPAPRARGSRVFPLPAPHASLLWLESAQSLVGGEFELSKFRLGQGTNARDQR